MTLGQSPNCTSALNDWIYALGDRDFRPTTVDATASYLRTLLYRRACLLVVDDVWETEHARPFIAGGPDCRLLITTRRAHIADELGADLYPLDVMTEAEAVALLRKRIEEHRLGGALSDLDLQYATALAEETGYLPLALELIGALVARGYSWPEVQNALSIGQESRDGGGTPQHRVRAKVEAVLRLSLNWLYAENPRAWECFALLGVLAEDAIITAAIAGTLWATSEADASQVLISLVDDAILQRRRGGVGLHDLMHDMARTLLVSPPPDGLGLHLPQAHGLLLQRYAQRVPPHRWDLLPDDGYIHARLFWHCAAAGENVIARALLEETTGDGKNAWYLARDRIGQSAGFLDDVRAAWQLEVSAADATLSRCCRYALMLASMYSLAEAISPRLAVVLVERGVWSLEKGVERVQQVRDPLERMDGLLGLLARMPVASATAEPYTTSRKLRDGVIQDIRSSVMQRMTGYRASRVLADLSYHLQGADQDEVILDAVTLVVHDFDELRGLSRYLPEGARARLVDRVRQMYEARRAKSSPEKAVSAAVETPKVPEFEAYLERMDEHTDRVAPPDIEPILASWGGGREKEDLTASEAKERFSELLEYRLPSDGGIEEAIRLAPFLPQPRERFFRDLLSVFKGVGKERCGEFLVSVAPLISSEAVVELAGWLIAGDRGSVGGKCLLAEYEPAPARAAVLASLRGDVEQIADIHEREAALIAIAKSCPLNFVQALMSSWQPSWHIGDRRQLASLILTFAPFVHGALDSKLFETLWDDAEVQIKTLWRMMVDMSAAINSASLVDFVKEAASFSSEWWVVEALTLTVLRVKEVDQIIAILQASEQITASDGGVLLVCWCSRPIPALPDPR